MNHKVLTILYQKVCQPRDKMGVVINYSTLIYQLIFQPRNPRTIRAEKTCFAEKQYDHDRGMTL